MNPLVLIVPGRPVPWARANVFKRTVVKGLVERNELRTPEQQREHLLVLKSRMLHARSRARWAGPYDGPLTVRVLASYPLTKKATAGQPFTQRPDADNLLKMVLDAGNGMLWLDDSQVIECSAAKVYDHVPNTKIAVWRHDSITDDWRRSMSDFLGLFAGEAAE